MILEKQITFNFNDIDSVILTLAEEVNKGFTVDKIEQMPLTLCIKTYYNEPTCKIYLRKKVNNK